MSMRKWACVYEGAVTAFVDSEEAPIPNPGVVFVEVFEPNLPFMGALYFSTIGFQPSIYHYHDSVNDEWDLDTEALDIGLKESLKQHRDSKLSVGVTYMGKNAKNTPDERALIVGIIEYLKAHNEDIELDWKQPDGIFTKAKLEHFQGFILNGGAEMQKAFTAENYILNQHQNTPYTFVVDALNDYDDYYNNL